MSTEDSRAGGAVGMVPHDRGDHHSEARVVLDAGSQSSQPRAVRRRKVAARKRQRARRGPVVHFWIPRSLDVASALRKGFDASPQFRGMKPSMLERCVNYAHYWIDSTVRSERLWRTDEEGFARQMFELIGEVIPRAMIKPLRTALVGGGVFKWDNEYVIGEKAMGHKLSDIYRGIGFRKVVCDDDAFADKVMAFRRRYFRPAMKLPVHRHLLKWYRQVQIDLDGAYEAILGMHSVGPNGGDVREASRLLVEAINDITSTDPRCLDFTYCRMGRVHTLITRLPKVLRPYVTIDGQTLINLDVTASQPTLLSLAVRQFRHNSNRIANNQTNNNPNPGGYYYVYDSDKRGSTRSSRHGS